MVTLASFRQTGCLVLALAAAGCTPPSFLQPSPPPSITPDEPAPQDSDWAAEYREKSFSNPVDNNKSVQQVVDDNSGGLSSGPNDPLVPNSATPRMGKQIPLKRESMVVMPTKAYPPKPVALDDRVQPSALDAPLDQPLDIPAPNSAAPMNGVPPPGMFPQDGKIVGSNRPLPPNIRQTPTVSGEILNLAPHENPTGKAVEFALALARCQSENQLLATRIRSLETELETRSRSLAESSEEVEQASAEIARARQELQTLRKTVMGLKERLKEIEKEDIETLRSIVSALEKLLEPGPRLSLP